MAADDFDFLTLDDITAIHAEQLALYGGTAGVNKRTAVVAAVEFLARNGYRVIAGDRDMYDLTMSIANKLANKQTVGEWFRQRLSPMP